MAVNLRNKWSTLVTEHNSILASKLLSEDACNMRIKIKLHPCQEINWQFFPSFWNVFLY